MNRLFIERRWLYAVILLLVTILPLASSQARQRQPTKTKEIIAVVSRVVDGDTIVVGSGIKAITVRLRCIDTPEIAHRKRRGEAYGPEAAAFTKSNLLGKRVRLLYHAREPWDRYNRLLAYVFLDDGTLFNAELVRHGVARVSRFHCLYRERVKTLEAEARKRRRGLWSGNTGKR